MAYDLVIKNGTVVDGTGGAAYRADVALKDGKIAEIGDLKGSAAGKTLDADGLTVAPGFFDVHTHYDCQLLWDPLATSSCWQGVTTVLMGNCGFTIAPGRPSDAESLMRLMARVRDVARHRPPGSSPAFAASRGRRSPRTRPGARRASGAARSRRRS